MLLIIIILLGIIAICGFALLLYLYNLYYKNPHRNIIIMIGITIILNIMIFTFCIISYSNVKVIAGPIGPQGNRGYRGDDGDDGGFKICGDLSVSASEKKFKIKNQELRSPHKPQIIE